MARKQPSKKRQKKRPKNLPQKTMGAMRLLQYEITYDPVEDPTTDQLPLHVHEEFEEIYYMVTKQPKKAIPRLKELIKEYPHIPKLYNYLCVAYSHISDRAKTDEVTLELYEKHPDYLFAKIQYAELCLRKNEIEKIPAIFDNKFDLQILYPERNIFHISEALAFMGFMGEYSCQKNDSQQAEMYLNLLKQLEPEDIRTKNLEKKLMLFSLFKKTFHHLGDYIRNFQQKDALSKK